MSRLVHYSAALVERVESRDPGSCGIGHSKPFGFWVSVEGENDWLAWCLGEEFCLDKLTHIHDVDLAPDARILRMSSAYEIDAFTREYAIPDGWRNYDIDWARVGELHQGIIIAPYCWSRRLDGNAGWYYGWDCASGCIWDAAAIASIRLREIVPAPEAHRFHADGQSDEAAA